MHRAVTALLGPTNTGKTHLAIERMLTHPSGMIGFPLRLLARENYDRVAALVGADRVALVTGEERIVPPRPTYWIATVEAMPVDVKVDFLAVDEVQLAADRERGHVFTDRILHARGAPRDVDDRRGDGPPDPAQAAARRRVPDARAPVDAVVRGAEAPLEAAAALGGHRLLGARAVRGRRATAPRARRCGARLRRALAAHAQRAGRPLPGRRGRPPRRHRRDRHGPEPRHRHRRVHGPHEVRRRRAAPADAGRGRPDRRPRRPPRARRPVRGHRRAGPARPAPRRGGGVAPLRPARPRLLADRRARLLLAARPPRQPRAPAARTRSSCGCATPRTSARSPRSPATRRRWRSRRDPDAVRLLWEVCQVPGLPERPDGGAHAPPRPRLPLPALAGGAHRRRTSSRGT